MVQITAPTLTQGPVCLRHRRSISHKLNKKDSNKDITPSPFSATNNHTGVVVKHELWSDLHWPGSGRPDVTGTGRAQDATDSKQKGTPQPREREPEARQYHQRASKETRAEASVQVGTAMSARGGTATQGVPPLAAVFASACQLLSSVRAEVQSEAEAGALGNASRGAANRQGCAVCPESCTNLLETEDFLLCSAVEGPDTKWKEHM